MSIGVMQLYTRAMSANSLDTRGPHNIMPDEPIKPRIRPDGKPYYDRNKSGSEIASVFHWDIKDDELLPLNTAARRKHRQKNFVALNVEEVKRIEERVKDVHKKSKEEVKAELAKPLWKSDKYNGIGSKIAKDIAHHEHDQTGQNGLPNSAVNGELRQSRPQTAGHSKNSHMNIPNGLVLGNERSKSVEPRKSDRIKAKKDKNDARTSIKRVPSASEMEELKKKMDRAKLHPRGQVPEYIKQRKQECQIANEPVKKPETPPGHVLMNEDEKEKTLASLKRAEADLLKRFNSLPVRTDTDFLKRKKQQLLRQLAEVDEAIKIFSRPKVYIKVDPR